MGIKTNLSAITDNHDMAFCEVHLE